MQVAWFAKMKSIDSLQVVFLLLVALGCVATSVRADQPSSALSPQSAPSQIDVKAKKYIDLNALVVVPPIAAAPGMADTMVDAGDLNGDGQADLCLILDREIDSRTQRVVQAVSAHGKRLWETVAPLKNENGDVEVTVNPVGVWSIPDITGDEHRDLCLADGAGSSRFAIMNGADGSTTHILTENNPHRLALGNVFPASGQLINDLVFATLPNYGRDEKADRLGFSFVSTNSLKPMARYNNPFKRIASASTFLGGGLVTNEEGLPTPMLLVAGKSRSLHSRAPHPLIAAIHGRWFNNPRYARINIDLTKPGIRFAMLDVIERGSRFPKIAVLQRTEDQQSQLFTVVDPDKPKEVWTQSFPYRDELMTMIAVPQCSALPKGGFALGRGGAAPEIRILDCATNTFRWRASFETSKLTIQAMVATAMDGQTHLAVVGLPNDNKSSTLWGVALSSESIP